MERSSCEHGCLAQALGYDQYFEIGFVFEAKILLSAFLFFPNENGSD
jgi:hypothetical protein